MSERTACVFCEEYKDNFAEYFAMTCGDVTVCQEHWKELSEALMNSKRAEREALKLIEDLRIYITEILTNPDGRDALTVIRNIQEMFRWRDS